MADGRRPERTCIGCRRRRPAAELIRLACTPDGDIAVSARAAGRGAWVCAGDGGWIDETCWSAAVRRKAFERAWRRPVAGTSLPVADVMTGTKG